MLEKIGFVLKHSIVVSFLSVGIAVIVLIIGIVLNFLANIVPVLFDIFLASLLIGSAFWFFASWIPIFLVSKAFSLLTGEKMSEVLDFNTSLIITYIISVIPLLFYETSKLRSEAKLDFSFTKAATSNRAAAHGFLSEILKWPFTFLRLVVPCIAVLALYKLTVFGDGVDFLLRDSSERFRILVGRS